MVFEPRLLPGGGATEMAVSQALSKKAQVSIARTDTNHLYWPCRTVPCRTVSFHTGLYFIVSDNISWCPMPCLRRRRWPLLILTR